MKFFIINKKDIQSENIKKEMIEQLQKKDFVYNQKSPDYVISIGGDGTLLRSIHEYEHQLKHVIFIGIHTGRLGFLCNYLSSDYEKVIQDLIEHKDEYEKIKMLQIDYLSHHYYALNEIRIESPYRTMIAEVSINQKVLETYRGNGLNFSTSIGSSGYNHSLNGPLINPKLDTIIISEIAGIHHNAYRSLKSPLVLCNKEEIHIKGIFKDCIIGYDHLFENVKKEEEITLNIHLSNKSIKLLNTKHVDYYDRLKNAFIV